MNIMVFFFQLHCIPSGQVAFTCKWGRIWSIMSKKPIPIRNPTTAGTKPSFPMCSDISMDGIKSDQTEAATITPEANPSMIFCIFGGMDPFKKNTQAAPRVVPTMGTMISKIVFKFK